LILEDQVQRKYAAYAHSTSFSPFEIAGRIPVVPGKYKLDVYVINHKTGRSYRDQTSVVVPANAKDTWISGPLLADSVSNAAHPGATVPYQYFGVQFHPLFQAELSAATKLRVLYQLYQPQPTDYDVEYILANVIVREARIIVKEHVAATELQNNLLLKSKTLDTSTLPAGEYILALQIKTAQGAVVASTNQRLHIVSGVPEATLYFLADPQSLETPGLVEYMRGLSAMAQDQHASAQNYFERSLKKNPANRFGKQFLVRAYYRQRKYKAIGDLYRSGSLKDFDASPEVLAEIAISLWDAGNPDEGRTVLKSARGLFPEDAFLAAADKLFSQAKN
jgi:tetratricopeptide (TPR) repeat protein